MEAPARQVAHVQKVRINFMKLMLALRNAFIATAREALARLVVKVQVEGMCWVGRFVWVEWLYKHSSCKISLKNLRDSRARTNKNDA